MRRPQKQPAYQYIEPEPVEHGLFAVTNAVVYSFKMICPEFKEADTDLLINRMREHAVPLGAEAMRDVYLAILWERHCAAAGQKV